MGCGTSRRHSLQLQVIARKILALEAVDLAQVHHWHSARLVNVSSPQNDWKLIHLAAYAGNLAVLAQLLQQKADVNALDCVSFSQHRDSPLHLAVWQGHIDVAKLLLQAGADADLPNLVFLT